MARALGYFQSHYDEKGKYISPKHRRVKNGKNVEQTTHREPEEMATLYPGLLQGISEHTEGTSSPSNGDEKSEEDVDMELENHDDYIESIDRRI